LAHLVHSAITEKTWRTCQFSRFVFGSSPQAQRWKPEFQQGR